MKGKYDNPKINAILLYKGDINETEYIEKKRRMEEAQKKRIQKLKMKNLLIKKHDIEDEFDEALELSTEDDIITTKIESTILSTLSTPAGGYIIVSLLLFFGFWVFADKLENKEISVDSLKKNN